MIPCSTGYLRVRIPLLGLSLITYIGVLLAHTNHDTLVTGTTNNGWEYSSWSIISSKASFAHAGAIVNNQSSNVFVTHVGYLILFFKNYKLRQRGLKEKCHPH